MEFYKVSRPGWDVSWCFSHDPRVDRPPEAEPSGRGCPAGMIYINGGFEHLNPTDLASIAAGIAYLESEGYARAVEFPGIRVER